MTDESGNSDTTTATVSVFNAAPVLNGTAFTTAASPFATGATAGDGLGSAIATGGGYELIGAPLAGTSDTGAAYLYDAAGALVQTFTGPAASSSFGSAVAIVGNYAAIGAPAAGSGTVYVYDLATGSLVQIIAGPSGVAGDRFGSAVTALGGLLAIGAPGRAVGGAAGAGAAFLFDPATGLLLQTYRNPTPQAGDAFGSAIAAVGGNLLIGAPFDDTAGLDAGAAYLVDPGTAHVLSTLTNPNPIYTGSTFGSVLAASGLHAAVGAPLDDSAGTDAGGVFIFNLDPSSASFGTLLKTVRSPNASPNDGKFGSSLAFVGNRLLVGVEGDGTTLANSGSAF